MRVSGFRLITGEDIVAAIVPTQFQQGANLIRLKKPAIVAQMSDHMGKITMGLADWMPFADPSKKDIDLNKDKIMFEWEPAADIVNAYNTRFGSGLVIPQKPGVFPFTNSP